MQHAPKQCNTSIRTTSQIADQDVDCPCASGHSVEEKLQPRAATQGIQEKTSPQKFSTGREIQVGKFSGDRRLNWIINVKAFLGSALSGMSQALRWAENKQCTTINKTTTEERFEMLHHQTLHAYIVVYTRRAPRAPRQRVLVALVLLVSLLAVQPLFVQVPSLLLIAIASCFLCSWCLCRDGREFQCHCLTSDHFSMPKACLQRHSFVLVPPRNSVLHPTLLCQIVCFSNHDLSCRSSFAGLCTATQDPIVHRIRRSRLHAESVQNTQGNAQPRRNLKNQSPFLSPLPADSSSKDAQAVGSSRGEN